MYYKKNKHKLSKVSENFKYKNIHSIDSLRGIASLIVVIFHLSHGNANYLNHTNLVYKIGQYGWVGVEIFFIISGFVIPYAMMRSSYKINDFFRFLLKRILRIDPPYILSIILVIILAYISTLYPYYRGKPFDLDFTQIALHFAYLNTFFNLPWLNPVFWSLAIEFQYYLLIAITFPLIVNKKKTVRYFSYVVFFAISFIIPEKKFIFHFSLLFLLGITLFLYQVKRINKYELIVNIIVLLIGIYMIYNKVIFAATIFSVIFIMFTLDYNNKLLKFFGKISYSLYLIHVPIGGRIINFMEQFTPNQTYRLLGIVVGLGISIFASWLFYIIIEKWSKNLSKKISYKKVKNKGNH